MTAMNIPAEQRHKGESPQALELKILCVDDEKNVLKSLQRLLRMPHYAVSTALSAQQGFELLRKNHFDIVISDMRMPEINGAEFLGQVATQYPNSHRILLTGYSDIESTIAAVNRGRISRYIQKPWNNEELLHTVREVDERIRLEKSNKLLQKQIERQNTKLKDLNNSLEYKVALRTQQVTGAMNRLKTANRVISSNLNSTIRSFYNLISLHPHLSGEQAIKISELCALFHPYINQQSITCKELKLSGLLSQLGLLGAPESVVQCPINEQSAEQKSIYLEYISKTRAALSPATSLKRVADNIHYQYVPFSESARNEEGVPTGAQALSIARDYIFAIEGRLYRTKMSSNGAIEYLTSHAGHLYDPQLIAILPQLIKELGHTPISSNEQILGINRLKAGMQLSRDVFNGKALLLLPEGHILTTESIKRLANFAKTEHTPLELFVFSEGKKS